MSQSYVTIMSQRFVMVNPTGSPYQNNVNINVIQNMNSQNLKSHSPRSATLLTKGRPADIFL